MPFNYICAQCGIPVVRDETSKYKMVFCSRTCHGKWKRKTAGQISICPTCKKPFVLETSRTTRTFCSRRCWKNKPKPIEGVREKFWSRVKKTKGCWIWTGATIRGYGQIRYGKGNGKLYLAHRLSWQLHYGKAPPSGLGVLHHCDNPPCVNPEHLWLGTQADNAADMVSKGRHLTPRDTQPNARRLTYEGRSLKVSEWAKIINITQVMINRRLRQGFTVEQALQPKKKPVSLKRQ